MDDKLILAVFNYPELYNVTLPNYRCTESRANAWRNISSDLGLPSDECKRKWKNMRDRYLKEVRMEIKGKKQGEPVQSRWKHRQLMNFIAPYAGSRSGAADVCGGNDDDDRYNLDNESGSADGDNASSETVKTPQPVVKAPASQPDLKPQVSFGTPSATQDAQMSHLAALAKMPSCPQITPSSKTGRKRRPAAPESLSPPSSQSAPSGAKWPVKDNGAALPSRQRDEDELFLLSFVPALKRLAPQKRCETKIRIQQVMYEAEFNVARPECQDKHPETETQD
ncbi:uncharacterized protein [Brachionichthys hirsutus]|uniref:uncharacterized protein n=1 Tax=Brachionichthys hirsutus TaxID=412623 RepID=UPI003605414A